MNEKKLHGSSVEAHNNMLRIVAGQSLDEKAEPAPPEGIAKIEKSWWFDFSIMGIIVLNLIFLATDPTDIALDEQTSTRQNVYIFIDVVYVGEFIVRVIAMNPAIYFRTTWMIFDFINAVEALFHLLLKLIGWIYEFNGGSIRPFLTTVFPVLQCIRTLKLFRLFNPYGLSAPFPSVLYTMNAIGETFDRIVLIVVMIMLVMVTAALLSNIVFADSLNYRCIPDPSRDSSSWHENVYNDSMYITYGADFFNSSYNDRHCGFRSGARTCETGFNCTNIGIGFGDGMGSFAEPGTAFLANLTFITMRGWGNLFFALVDANGPALSFALLLSCILIVAEIYVNMIAAVFSNNMRQITSKELKEMIAKKFPGTKDTTSELEMLLWAYNSGIFIETKLEEDKILTNAIKALKDTFKNDEDDIGGIEKDGVDANNEGKKKKKKKRRKKGSRQLVPGEIESEDEEEEIWQPNCKGCDNLRVIIASDGGPLSIFVIMFVFIDTLALAFDSNDPSDDTIQAMEVINLTSTIVFIVDVVLRIAVMGPYMFFDSSFNILDFTLVVFNCISFATSSVGFVSNFRMLRLLRLMRLYKVAFLLKLKEGQAISDPSLGLVRFLSLMMELGRPMIIYSVMLCAALFTMAVVGMQCFGTATSQLTEYDENFPGLTPLVLMWNGIYTERMIFTDFSRGFITLFNMSCLDGWYPVMYTFITSSGVVSTVFFITWIIVSNWLMQALLTASIMMEMEKLAREYVLCASIGNKIVVQNVISIQQKRQMTVAFNMMAKFAADADGHVLDEDENKHALIKEEKEKEPELTWLEAFFKERENWKMYIVKPGGALEKLIKAIKKSAAFNLAVSGAVIISVLQILNSSRDVNDTGRFYFSPEVWIIVDLVVFVVFLAEMFFEWCVSGIYSPWSTCYFSNPVNWLEFIVNAMMVISLFVTDPAAKAIFKKFRIIRIAKLPGIITSFSSDRSLSTFLTSISASFTSLSSVVTAALSFVFFFGIIGVQIFKSLFNRCSYDLYPDGRAFDLTSSAYPYGCDDASGNMTTVNYTTTYSGKEVLSVERPIDHFDNAWAGMLSVFRIFMLNEWQGIMYNGLDTVEKGYQPGDLTSKANFLFFVPVLLIGLVMLTLLIGVIYYHFIVVNTFTGYRVRQLSWTQWLSNEAKVESYHKVIFGSREALWVTYEEMLTQVNPLTTPPRPSEYNVEPTDNFPGVPNPQYYIWLVFSKRSYKVLVSCFFAFPMFLIIAYYSTTYGRNEWVYYDTIFSMVYLIEYVLRLYVYGPSSTFKTVVGMVDVVFATILAVSFFYFYTHPTGDWGPLDRNILKVCVIVRSFRIITAFEITQNMTQVATTAWSGFVPLFLYLFTTLLIYAVIGSLIFPKNTISTGNEFIDAHYNFQTLRNGITTLLIVGTGNVWSEVISELDDGESTIHTFVTYIFFFSFYITIVIVFRLFSLMNIQKTRLQDYKTSVLAQQQILQFQLAWQQVLAQQNILNISDGTINVESLYALVAMLPRPLGLYREGQKSILFQDLDNAVRTILLSVPKAPVGKDEYALTRSNFAFNEGLLPEKVVGELMARVDSSTIPVKRRKSSIANVITGGFVGGRAVWKFTFQEILIAVHRAAIIQSQPSSASKRRKERRLAKKHAAGSKYFLSSFLVNHFFTSKIDNPQSHNLLLLQRLDREIFEILFVEVMTFQIDSLNNRIKSCGSSHLDSMVCSKLKACIDHHVHMAKLQYSVGKLLSEGSTDHLTEEHKRCLDAADFYSNVKLLKASIYSIYEQNVSQTWNLETLQQVSQISEARKHITALHIDKISTIYIGYSDGTIKIWKRSSHASLFVTKETNFKKFQMIESEPGLYAIALSSDLKRLVATTENNLFLYTIDSRNATKTPMFKFILKMTAHSQAVHCSHFFESHLLSASADGTIKMWAGSTTKPHPLRSTSTGAPVNSMCVINLLNYLQNSDSQREKYAVTHAVCAGCANGDLAVFPLPVERSTLEITFWNGRIVKSSDLKLQMTISCVAIAWNFLYIGYVNGSICVYAIKIDPANANVFFTDECAAMNELQFIHLKTYHVHSDPITGIKMAGGHLFTSSLDMSIMKWYMPLNVEADSVVEWSQSHGEAMVIHTSPILALSANDYCMISGDKSGKMVITAPKDTMDSLEGSSPKLTGEPVIDFSFVSHDFGPVYLPTQGVVSVEEKILRIHNRSTQIAVVRRISAASDAFKTELLPELSLCSGSTLTAHEDDAANENSNSFGLAFMGGLFGYNEDESKFDAKRMDVLNLEPNQYGFYRVSFFPPEQKRYASKSNFIINDGEQSVTVNYYGRGEKISIMCTPLTPSLVDFGECSNGQVATGKISLINGGSRPIVVHTCDTEIETKAAPGEDIEEVISTMMDRDVTVVPHATYLWPGKSFEFTLYYEPAKDEPDRRTQLSSFTFPIQFAFNGQISAIGDCVAQMTTVEDDAAKEARLKEEGLQRAQLDVWLKRQCADEDKIFDATVDDIARFQWDKIAEWGKNFSRTEEGAYDYEDIVRFLHIDAAFKYHHEMLLHYSRAGLYHRGTRQLLLVEAHITENFLHEELKTIGWRCTHDQEMMVLLHKSGLFLEILLSHLDQELSVEEQEAMNTICLNMKFASQCKYKVVIGDALITEGITGEGVMGMFGGEKKVFMKGTNITREIMKGRDGLYQAGDKLNRDAPPDCSGLIMMELHVWAANASESDSKCIYFIDIHKGYRIIRDRWGKISWYDRMYVKGIRMINTTFDNQKDKDQKVPWCVDVDSGNTDYKLDGYINERFGIREHHGRAELIKHRGRPHCFPCIRFVANRPERFNTFLVTDSVTARCRGQNRSQSTRFEWYGTIDFPPGERVKVIEIGRPDLADSEIRRYKSLRSADGIKIVGNDEEYHPYIMQKRDYDEGIWVDDTLANTDPNSSEADPDVPFRALKLQAVYKSSRIKEDPEQIAYIYHEVHYGRGTFARTRVVNEMLNQTTKRRRTAAIESAMKALTFEHIEHKDEDSDEVISVEEIGVRPFDGLRQDDKMRREGLEKAAESADPTFEQRRIHHRRVLPRSVHSSRRKVSCRSAVFSDDKFNIPSKWKQEQRKFELLMDYLLFSDDEPAPKNITIEENGYYGWLYQNHYRYYLDKVLGDHWAFVRDQLNIRLLATASMNNESGATVVTERTMVTNVSHIEEAKDAPGEIIMTSAGCAITKGAEILRDTNHTEKIMNVHFNDDNTIRISDVVVLKGSFRPSPHGESIHTENRCDKSLYWMPPPAHIKHVYHLTKRNQQITRMYNLLCDYLLQIKIKKLHDKEVEAARKASEQNQPIAYTGAVTKEMKDEAKAKVKDDKQIGHKEVYEYLLNASNDFCKKNIPPPHHQSLDYRASQMDKDKLDLGKLCHYLTHNPLPGFEEPFEEPVIHLMFEEWETKRETGIPLSEFKKFILNAAKDSGNTDSVDYLNAKNTFAFLLDEENIRYRGFVFDNFDRRALESSPSCPVIQASVHRTVLLSENIEAANKRKTLGRSVTVNYDSIESTMEANNDEQEDCHNIGNVIVGNSSIVEHKEENDGPPDGVKDDGTAETNANTSINADEIGDGDADRSNTEANGTDVRNTPVPQEPGIFNLFGLF